MPNIYLNNANEAKLLELLQLEELNAANLIDRIEEIIRSIPVVGEAAEELKANPPVWYTETQIKTFKKLIEEYRAGKRSWVVKYPDTDISKELELEWVIEFFNFYDLYDKYNQWVEF